MLSVECTLLRCGGSCSLTRLVGLRWEGHVLPPQGDGGFRDTFEERPLFKICTARRPGLISATWGGISHVEEHEVELFFGDNQLTWLILE